MVMMTGEQHLPQPLHSVIDPCLNSLAPPVYGSERLSKGPMPSKEVKNPVGHDGGGGFIMRDK
jgi:hypothetical protein